MSLLTAGCKVNLGLRITGVRADGYHELDSLFYPLPRPCDQLRVRAVAGPGISVRCAAPDVEPARNTLTRAYAALAERVPAGALPGIEVTLRKGIPTGAGLGGGSSDAAALLRWLNGQLAAPLGEDALCAVALKVGADTPFFLQNGPCRVRGIGEILTPAGVEYKGLRMVLVCPGIHVSTPQAYADYDAAMASAGGQSGQNDLTKTQTKANGTFLSGERSVWSIHNDLEAVVFARQPQLADIKADLLRMGAKAACMSGSGAGVFGLFTHEALVETQAAAAMLQGENRRVYTHVL